MKDTRTRDLFSQTPSPPRDSKTLAKPPPTKTIESCFQPVRGDYEPWYCTKIADALTDHFVKAWWECPHCRMAFKSRKACEMHCKGKAGQFPPTCAALKHINAPFTFLTSDEESAAIALGTRIDAAAK